MERPPDNPDHGFPLSAHDDPGFTFTMGPPFVKHSLFRSYNHESNQNVSQFICLVYSLHLLSNGLAGLSIRLQIFCLFSSHFSLRLSAPSTSVTLAKLLFRNAGFTTSMLLEPIHILECDTKLEKSSLVNFLATLKKGVVRELRS